LQKSVIDNNALLQFEVWDFPGEFGQDTGSNLYNSTASVDTPNQTNEYGLHDESNGPSAAELNEIYATSTAIIFVIDAQDEPYDSVLQQMTLTIRAASKANPEIAIEIFINKIDGELFLSDEAKYETRRGE
tara:strand:+ start:293 stop:685 length:393 start_codon:yes stop_codon:yes gene_type:complete